MTNKAEGEMALAKLFTINKRKQDRSKNNPSICKSLTRYEVKQKDSHFSLSFNILNTAGSTYIQNIGFLLLISHNQMGFGDNQKSTQKTQKRKQKLFYS